MSDNVFDFGFTTVDETELEAVQNAELLAGQISASASDFEKRLDALYNAITPLLNNLKANPEKEYIYWPNRIEKVEQFETHLYKIYKNN